MWGHAKFTFELALGKTSPVLKFPSPEHLEPTIYFSHPKRIVAAGSLGVKVRRVRPATASLGTDTWIQVP